MSINFAKVLQSQRFSLGSKEGYFADKFKWFPATFSFKQTGQKVVYWVVCFESKNHSLFDLRKIGGIKGVTKKQDSNRVLLSGEDIETFMLVCMQAKRKVHLYSWDFSNYEGLFIEKWLIENYCNRLVHGQYPENWGEYYKVEDKKMLYSISWGERKNRVTFDSLLNFIGKNTLPYDLDKDLKTTHMVANPFFDNPISTYDDQTKLFYDYMLFLAQVLPFPYWRHTQSSTAFNIFKIMFSSMKVESLIKNGFVQPIGPEGDQHFYFRREKQYLTAKRYEGKNKSELKNIIFEAFFPDLWIDKNIEKELRSFMVGGIIFANPDFIGKLVVTNHYDLVSSYLEVMMNYLFPIGRPINDPRWSVPRTWSNVFPSHPTKTIKFLEVTIKQGAEGINDEWLPFIRSPKRKTYQNDGGVGSAWTSIVRGGDVLHITEATYFEMLDKYHLTPEETNVKVMYEFEAYEGSKIFSPIYDSFFNLKKEATIENLPAERRIAKLGINGNFGYFARDPENLKEQDEIVYSYLPVSICIADYARLNLVKKVGPNVKRVVAAHTDSAKTTGGNWIERNNTLGNNELGVLKKERSECLTLMVGTNQLSWLVKDDDNWKLEGIMGGMNMKYRERPYNFKELFEGHKIETSFRQLVGDLKIDSSVLKGPKGIEEKITDLQDYNQKFIIEWKEKVHYVGEVWDYQN